MRSILCLEARADAGLAEGADRHRHRPPLLARFGAFFVRRYDERGRDRMDPNCSPTCTKRADTYRGGASL